MQEDDGGSSLWRFSQRVLLAVAIVAVALFVWEVRPALLLVFAGILLAVILRGIADRLGHPFGMRRRWSLFLTVILLVAALGLLSGLTGTYVAAEFRGLAQQIPQGLQALQDALQATAWGSFLLQNLEGLVGQGAAGGVISRIASAVTAVFAAFADLILVLILGLFLAAQPSLYRAGAVELTPPVWRGTVDSALIATGRALWLWVLGQLIAMVAVGILTALGLWLLGIPTALALGVIAGLLNFIPFVGPFLAAIPAILVGFTEGAMQALYVALLFLGIQQVEGNVIMPLAQRKVVALPPALALAGIIVFGLLFGPLGVLFGVPLTVAAMVLVKALYVERGLGEHTDIPGR